jgi:hypothetical protein
MYELLPVHAVSRVRGCRCSASGLVPAADVPNDPRVSQVQTLGAAVKTRGGSPCRSDSIVGVWVVEALEAGCELCLAGSPQPHVDVDLKDGTTGSGIWDYPMSTCYLWSCMPYAMVT